MPEKRSAPLTPDAREFSRFEIALAAITIAEFILSAALFGIVRPLFLAAGATLFLTILFIRLGNKLFAVRFSEILFGAVILGGLFLGSGHEYGTGLYFLPFFALYCLYFDGYAAFIASVAFGSGCIALWYAANRAAAMGFSAFVLMTAAIFIIFALSFLIMRNFFLSRILADDLLGELHHRVRNTLLIVRSLFPGKIEASLDSAVDPFKRFRIRVAAFRNVQALIARSRDLLQLSASDLAETVARATLGQLDMAPEIIIEGEGYIPLDRAGPLALLLSDWLSEDPLLKAKSLCIALNAGSGTGRLEIRAAHAQGRGGAAEPKISPLAEILLRQLGADRPKADADGLSVEFELAPPVTTLPPDSRIGRIVRMRKRNTFWLLFMGKAARSTSTLARSETATLALVIISMLAILIAQNLISLGSGSGLRLPGVLVALSTAPSFALLRKGKPRPAAYLFGASIIIMTSFSIFAGPDAATGYQLIATMTVSLYFIYFTGNKGGAASIAWGLAAHLAWFLFYSPKRIPLETFSVFAAAYCFFALSALLFIKNSHARLRAQESLIIDLRTRLVDFLDLILARIDGGADMAPDRFDAFVDGIGAVHTIVSESPDPASISMARALARLSEVRPCRIETRIAGIDSLPAEKATLVMMLVLELLGDGTRGPRAADCGVSLTITGRRASVAVRTRPAAEQSAAPLPARGGSVLKAIENLLQASKEESDAGTYAISFGF